MKQFRSALLYLGLYQIIGAVIGLTGILYTVFLISNFAGQSIVLIAFIAALFGYSILCGILCLKHHQLALKLSLVNQFLQLICVAFSGFAFSYVAGLYLSIGLDVSESFEINFGFGISKYDLSINNGADSHIVALNVVALALIYWIDKRSRKIAEEKSFAEVSSIGMNDQTL